MTTQELINALNKLIKDDPSLATTEIHRADYEMDDTPIVDLMVINEIGKGKFVLLS